MAFSDSNIGKLEYCELCGTKINNQETDYVSRVIKSGVNVTVQVHRVCKMTMLQHERKRYRENLFKRASNNITETEDCPDTTTKD